MGGPQIALSKDGIDLLSSFGLKFSETYGEDKEDRRQRFLVEMIRRFEEVGVQLGDIAYIRAPSSFDVADFGASRPAVKHKN